MPYSPLNAAVSFGAAVQTLELVQDRVFPVHRLLRVLQVGGVQGVVEVMQRAVVESAACIAADGAQDEH